MCGRGRDERRDEISTAKKFAKKEMLVIATRSDILHSDFDFTSMLCSSSEAAVGSRIDRRDA
jgi:hypothetical protein